MLSFFQGWCAQYVRKVKAFGIRSADGAPCEAGLEVVGCGGNNSHIPHCLPCGQKGESCCKVSNACEEGLMCLDYDLCGTCGGLQEPPCPSTITAIGYQCNRAEMLCNSQVLLCSGLHCKRVQLYNQNECNRCRQRHSSDCTIVDIPSSSVLASPTVTSLQPLLCSQTCSQESIFRTEDSNEIIGLE
jgi:hypothetical protein